MNGDAGGSPAGTAAALGRGVSIYGLTLMGESLSFRKRMPAEGAT